MKSSLLSPLQRSLIVAGGALLLPVIVLLALLLRGDFRHQQTAVEREAMDAATDTLLLADARIDVDIRLLRLLATSEALADRNWLAAEARAETTVELSAGWIAVVLTDTAAGRSIFDTDGLPPEQDAAIPLPPAAATVVVEGITRDGRHCPCVRLHALVPAAPELVLTAYLDPGVFREFLASRLPNDAVGAIVDPRGNFVARSIDHADRVGTPATEYVRAAVARGGSGIYAGTTFEGLANYTAYTTSERTGWSAHVAIDRRLVDAPRARARTSILIGAIVAVAVSGGMVAYALHDLTVRRREEARLLEIQKAEAIGRFTSTVVHDFNNLLAAMQACLRQIARATRQQRIRDLTEAGYAAIARGTRLTNQLLSFARQDVVELQDLDLETLLAGIGELLRGALGSGVKFSVQIDPDARYLRANGDQLELALVNLATNARDAMAGQGEFRLTARATDGMVELRAEDSGPGIPPELRDRVLEPLFTTKPTGQGTGLGLAQVAGAVRQAGGSIEIAAGQGGRGAAVVLRLPRAPADGSPAAHPAAATG